MKQIENYTIKIAQALKVKGLINIQFAIKRAKVYVIEATAGSGKTQLALKLLRDAAQQKQRARYVCFNRPLADHLAKLAPASVEVTTFHQLCRDWAERQGTAVAGHCRCVAP